MAPFPENEFNYWAGRKPRKRRFTGDHIGYMILDPKTGKIKFEAKEEKYNEKVSKNE
jgi:hypothetical protein